VNASTVTATGIITIAHDSSLGAMLGVTCNTATPPTTTITARSPGVSFTITSASVPVINPECLSFSIAN
jgi:hypothetical protein